MSQTDPDAWCAALYETEAPRLLLYGRALGLSHWEGEDVLQDTFVALARLEKPPREPRHYALRAFRNRALNYKRSLWRRCFRELESCRWFERSPEENPRERAAKRCLTRLPRAQREVIVLKIWHHYTFDQMSRLLGDSPNTLAGRYRYGLQKLRRFLKDPTYEYAPSKHHREALELLDPASSISSP